MIRVEASENRKGRNCSRRESNLEVCSDPHSDIIFHTCYLEESKNQAAESVPGHNLFSKFPLICM